MLNLFEEFLFRKHILVGSSATRASNEEVFATLAALANLFGIRVTSGSRLANAGMIQLAERVLGINVPEPFYRGFPQSVRELSPDKLLFDQLVHYTITYGFGDFSQPGHSILEKFERAAFKESTERVDFIIVTPEEAVAKLAEYLEALLSGTRPLTNEQIDLVASYIETYGYRVKNCAGKQTAIDLLLRFRDVYYYKFLTLSDVLKVADAVNAQFYDNENLKKLNFRNQDRRFIEKLLDLFFETNERCNVRECYERKALWNGLLHHIHYRAKNERAQAFVDAIRGKGARSVYSDFEREIARGEVARAVDVLCENKGPGAALRKLDYLISRSCANKETIRYVLDKARANNPIVLFQLLNHYANAPRRGQSRVFKFTRYNKLRVHTEREDEVLKRRSILDEEVLRYLSSVILDNLRELFRGKLGKVYVAPELEGIALPLQENVSLGGYGTLPTGSRFPIPDAKKIRAFTYWEKVDDIDLSMFGMDENGENFSEFSWRTMYSRQGEGITFSGDETSGYYGGSEYFDVNLEVTRRDYPHIRYLVFCDNVFTGGVTFQDCFCKAGYMSRDLDDSGQVYEPKTVKSSFLVNCKSRFAYLFAIDLVENSFIWLNIARDSYASVAGATSMEFLVNYLRPPVLGLKEFLAIAASEIVDDASRADLIVTDAEIAPQESSALRVSPRQVVLRSYDTEKILALMNGNVASVMGKDYDPKIGAR